MDVHGDTLKAIRARFMPTLYGVVYCVECEKDVCAICFGCKCAPCDCPPENDSRD